MRFRYDGPPTLHPALGLLEPGKHEHPDRALVVRLAEAGLVTLVPDAAGPAEVQTSAPAARPQAPTPPTPPAERDGEAGPDGEVEAGRKGRKRSSV